MKIYIYSGIIDDCVPEITIFFLDNSSTHVCLISLQEQAKPMNLCLILWEKRKGDANSHNVK